MLQHANIDTFIKHYLPQRFADICAIVSNFEPQRDLMRAASRMTRWIDPNRPQCLTLEQSQSVDKHPRLRQLLAQRARWNQRYKGTATKQSGYGSISSEIINLRQQLKAALLKKTRDTWDREHPVREVELQLDGLKFGDAPEAKVVRLPEMPLMQKRLVEIVMILSGLIVEEEFRRRNIAINAVAAYYHFQEGGAVAMPREKRPAQTQGSAA